MRILRILAVIAALPVASAIAQEASPPGLRGLGQMLLAPSLPAAPTDAAKLTYTPSMELRRANFARFVEKTRANDPELAANMEKLFAERDVMKLADDWMAPYGMKSDNVADTMAVYLANAWLATRGRTDDPSPEQMRGLKAQMAAAALATPQFASATDAVKQEMAEAMILQALIVSDFAETAKNNPQLQAQVRQAVATGAQASFGIDLLKLELGPNGLR
ncbi:hypothetical protein IAI18_05670 [Acetobacteraceae bacterium H6797]|nr:hypothetical protein [Acetobacteraceae bacterium H6797]